MSWLQIAALIALIVSGLVGEASRLAARQEAKFLRRSHPKRADDPRLETPEVTLHPAPDVDLMWGSDKGLPPTLGTMTRLHRASLTVAFVAGAVLLLTLVFRK